MPKTPGQQPTWATLRTAIFRTIGGARAPKDAGIDFWTLPKVMAPYLYKTGGRGTEVRQPSARHPFTALQAYSPVQSETVRGKEQVLRNIVASDVSQDVTCDHSHLGWVPTHTAGA